MSRNKIGVVLDYTLRFPNFKDCYTSMKKQILTGMDVAIEENRKDISERDFWSTLHSKDVEGYTFYETALPPQENWGIGFDYTWRKYFYNEEHLKKFLEDWSFNLFGQGLVPKKEDVNLFNICQSKVCDVVLLDKCTHTRKVPNTLAYLSKLGLFFKEIRFITEKELEELKTSKEFLEIYDASKDASKALIPANEPRKPSTSLLEFLMKIEKKNK